MTAEKTKVIPLHTKIMIGFIVGGAAGVTANQLTAAGSIRYSALEWVVENVTAPVGQIFLNLLFMVVIPIVFCSLSLGVARLGNVGKLGRLGVKTFGYFVITTTLSVTIGLILVNAFRPGEGFDRETQQALMERFGGQAEQNVTIAGQGDFWPDMLVGIVSRNPLRDAAETQMLPVIFFAILFGLALTMIPREQARPTMSVLEGVGDAMVVIVGFAMRLAPYAVPALIFGVTALFGWEILRQLLFFVVTVFIGYLLQLFGTYSVALKALARYSPGLFFKKMIPVMVTAFSTSSSNATLPTTIKTSEEEVGVPSEIAGFVLPLGATTNMNGTSMYGGIVVLFVAQVFGVELSLGTQLFVVVLMLLTAVAAAGVPSGSIPLLVVALETVGVPGEGIAIIIGVERLLDMGRTVVNVTGDATAACFIAGSEGYPLKTD
jgi:DAACS family dicarboxylate/amino acid:cation (Na+ or H+) symporter